eukprot:gene8102-1448_t
MLEAFSSELVKGLQQKSGVQVVSLLRRPGAPTYRETATLPDLPQFLPPDRELIWHGLASVGVGPWTGTVAHVLVSLKLKADGSPSESFRAASDALKEFRKLLKTGGPVVKQLYLPVWWFVLSRVRSAALAADGKFITAESSQYTNEVVRLLSGLSRPLQENPQLKIMGLYVYNALFKLFFKTNRLALMSKDMVDSAKELLKEFDRDIPMSQKKCTWDLGCPYTGHVSPAHCNRCHDLPSVTNDVAGLLNGATAQVICLYFVGRYNMFSGKYKEASDNLEFAFNHCDARYTKNKQRILISLVVVRMLTGWFPSTQLLERYHLPEFIDMATAMRSGNLQLLDDAIASHQLFLLHSGVYFVMQRARMVCFKNLLVRTYNVCQGLTTMNNRFPLVLIQEAMLASGIPPENCSIDELECLCSVLKNSGDMRGYIHHQSKKIILAPANPFPDE